MREWFDGLPGALILCDSAACILAANREAQHVLTTAEPDLIGLPLGRFIPREATGISEPALRRFVQRPIGQLGAAPLVTTALRGDDSSMHLELRVGSIGAVEGKSIYAISLRDVSEVFASEQRLSALNEQLASVAGRGATRTLAADLMHELNQPLAALTNYLEACKVLTERREPTDPRLGEMLDAALKQVGRAGEVVRHLRRFLVRDDVEPKRFAVERMVRDAVQLVMAGRMHTAVRCTLAFDPAAQAMVADEAQIQQVLVELLRHMIEALEGYAPHDSQLLIKTRRDGSDILLMLTDNGPGLSEQALRTLYEPYIAFQTDPDIDVGLMMSRRIIEGHGSRLIGENRSEGGTSFSFRLPTAAGGER